MINLLICLYIIHRILIIAAKVLALCFEGIFL